MEAVLGDDFLKWAASIGVGFDERYPDSRCLSFVPPRAHARFWVLPDDPAGWPRFVASLLSGAGPWSRGFLWPRAGTWPASQRSQSDNEGVRDVVLRGAGVPDGWGGALRFDESETRSVVAILFVSLAFGGCVEDDLFLIPDHGRHLIQTDHHDVVHVESESEDRIQQLVTHMSGEGYELPTEPPDWTFKWPAWMGPEPA